MVCLQRGQQEVYLFWGIPGSGKSHAAFEQAGVDAYEKVPTTKFWDGYTGQENIVIDDFCGDIGVTHLKRWLDKYPCKVECKFGCIPLTTKRWFITSNVPLEDWWPSIAQIHKDAIRRRFTKITHYDKVFKTMMPFEIDQELIGPKGPEIKDAIIRDDDEEPILLNPRRSK